MTADIFAFTDGARQAAELAGHYGIHANVIDAVSFPDGESFNLPVGARRVAGHAGSRGSQWSMPTYSNKLARSGTMLFLGAGDGCGV